VSCWICRRRESSFPLTSRSLLAASPTRRIAASEDDWPPAGRRLPLKASRTVWGELGRSGGSWPSSSTRPSEPPPSCRRRTTVPAAAAGNPCGGRRQTHALGTTGGIPARPSRRGLGNDSAVSFRRPGQPEAGVSSCVSSTSLLKPVEWGYGRGPQRIAGSVCLRRGQPMTG
jgi:hypothetical protein